jgi:hypothetical protein
MSDLPPKYLGYHPLNPPFGGLSSALKVLESPPDGGLNMG